MLGRLRAAGQAIRSFDDAYADKISSHFHNPEHQQRDALISTLIGSRIGHGEIDPGMPGWANNTARGIIMGVEGINLAARYGVPAGGLTAAGIGLHELSQQFGGMGDNPDPGSLPL